MWWGVLASTGVVLGAIYMLWMLQRVFFGEITNEKNAKLKDLNLREILVFIPLIVMIFWMGVYPHPLLDRAQPNFMDPAGSGAVVMGQVWAASKDTLEW